MKVGDKISIKNYEKGEKNFLVVRALQQLNN